jgi:hypothetical protein
MLVVKQPVSKSTHVFVWFSETSDLAESLQFPAIAEETENAGRHTPLAAPRADSDLYEPLAFDPLLLLNKLPNKAPVFRHSFETKVLLPSPLE